MFCFFCLSAHGTDLQYRIDATSLALSPFWLPPSPPLTVWTSYMDGPQPAYSTQMLDAREEAITVEKNDLFTKDKGRALKTVGQNKIVNVVSSLDQNSESDAS